MTIQLFCGDCLERMKEIESRSVDLTVTSLINSLLIFKSIISFVPSVFFLGASGGKSLCWCVASHSLFLLHLGTAPGYSVPWDGFALIFA